MPGRAGNGRQAIATLESAGRSQAPPLQWLTDAFGAKEKDVFRGEDGAIQHAELIVGAGVIMFGRHPRANRKPTLARGHGRSSVAVRRESARVGARCFNS